MTILEYLTTGHHKFSLEKKQGPKLVGDIYQFLSVKIYSVLGGKVMLEPFWSHSGTDSY